MRFSNEAFEMGSVGGDKKLFCVNTMSDPRTTIWIAEATATIDEGGNLWYSDGSSINSRICIPFHNIAQIQFR